MQSAKNASEVLFEEYLNRQGYSQWQHEPDVPGKKKRIDYRLEYRGGVYFLEVKEFDGPPMLEAFGSFDPYGPIRQKIDAAAKQFKDSSPWRNWRSRPTPPACPER
jgi:hypothetical protein